MRCLKMKARKGLAVSLAIVLAMSTLMSVSAKAAASSTPKEEVVYVNLNGDGSVKEINVVNIFDLDEAGQIVDYGAYESVRNMTTTDEIQYADGTVTIDAEAGKLYYEGKLASDVMPWDIEIQYFMDGKEYSAEEITGMSGALKLTIKITENTQCHSNFFEGYALQASVTLDTDQCTNIIAEDATVANVGSDKQLTYTILPDEGADIEITADVTEFEMDGISVNGIPLSMTIEVDDSDWKDSINDLVDAVEELDDGVGELHDGVSELKDSAKDDLQKGVGDLEDGANALDKGTNDLNKGIEQMQKALKALNKQSPNLTKGSAEYKAALLKLQTALQGVSVTTEDLTALTEASSAIRKGIDELSAGIATLEQNVSVAAYKAAMKQNGLDIDELKQNNSAAAAGLEITISGLKAKILYLNQNGGDTSEIAQLEQQVEQLGNVVALLRANNACIGGTETYLSTLNANIAKLKEGAGKLQTNYVTFDTEINNLAKSLGSLGVQMSSLATAVNTLVTEYSKLDSGITEYTDAVSKIVTGYKKIADGAEELVSGSKSLKSGTKKLSKGTEKLVSGIEELYDGADELKDGTGTMREETADMDTEIDDKIDEMLDSITGGDMEFTSFVSDKNTNTESVQFVIKTDGLKLDEEEIVEEEETKQQSFWEKLKALFEK